MTTINPITPPPELVKQWVTEVWHEGTPARLSLSDMHIAAEAAIWAADQELEACVEWLDRNSPVIGGFHLRIDRRPRPPSLKEQALAEVAGAVAGGNITPERGATIRRALKALND